ncbi:MAG: hypothetical protein ACLGIO_03180 [Acidimicrobiia bacterium]
MDSDHPGGTNGERPVAASDLVAACEDAWRAIQARHPGVPDTVVVLGSGVERGRLVKLGHWWGGQWRVGGEARGEVLLAGEALHLSAEQVFEVLLHEAAHGLNATRGLRDASRGGRYHNQHFKAAAAEVGLRPRRLDPYGWARTELTPATVAAYGEVIGRIGTEMRLARGLPAQRPGGVEVGTGGFDGDGAGAEAEGDGEGRRPPQRAAECGCTPARKLRMAPSVLALGPVTCGLCGAGFAVRGAEVRQAAAAAAGVVDERFVARRVEALAAEAAEARVIDGMAHLDRMGRAIDEVAPELVDGALLVEAFDTARVEIAEWFAGVARRSPAESVAEAELDLRTVDLPGLGGADFGAERCIDRGVESPLVGVEPPLPGPAS